MKRFFIWVSVILVGCCSMISSREIRRNVDVVSVLKDSTIALVTNHTSEDYTYELYCSGVWISRRHILTARHCVPHSDPAVSMLDEAGVSVDLVGLPIKYSTRGDYQYVQPGGVRARDATIVAIDPYQDLAIIKAEDHDIPRGHEIAQISLESPEDGESVHIVGHTMGMSWTYLKGYISATRSPIFDAVGQATKTLQIASPAYKGNSGGGAFNERGELVGISSWVSLASPEMGFWIHKDEILSFINRSKLD